MKEICDDCGCFIIAGKCWCDRVPRPIEPYSESENPERWAEIAAWEENRALELIIRLNTFKPIGYRDGDGPVFALREGQDTTGLKRVFEVEP